MNRNDTDEDFHGLATRYLEDALGESEVLMLGQELDRYPARVEQFNDLRILTGLIHEHGQSADERGPQFTQPNAVAPADRMRTKWLPPVTLGSRAASILLAITCSLWLFAPSPIAILVSGENASWKSSLPTSKNSELGPGILNLKSGIATIRFRSGALVTLQAPSDLELPSPVRGRMLVSGASVEVPDPAIEFTMESPHGYVIDHGTDFPVSVDPFGPEVVQIGTGGREGSAICNDAREYISPKYLTVNRLFNKGWDRRSFFAFDLSTVDLDKFDYVTLRVNLVPFPYGTFGNLPKTNRYEVYGLTNPEKADWKNDSLWKDSPAPEDGVLVGSFDIPRSQQRGSFKISNEELWQFLIEHEEREVTFIVVRKNLPLKNGNVPCHAFAGHRHPDANGPQLEFGLEENE